MEDVLTYLKARPRHRQGAAESGFFSMAFLQSRMAAFGFLSFTQHLHTVRSLPTCTYLVQAYQYIHEKEKYSTHTVLSSSLNTLANQSLIGIRPNIVHIHVHVENTSVETRFTNILNIYVGYPYPILNFTCMVHVDGQ